MTEASGELDFVEILAQVEEQMAQLAAIQKKQAALVSTATAADGRVTVSVNARGVVIETRIDSDYFDEYDLVDLGGHITCAAQAAAQDVQSRASALMEPALERRKTFPSLSEIVDGAPDIRQLAMQVPQPSLAPPESPERLNLESDPRDHGQTDEESWFGIRA